MRRFLPFICLVLLLATGFLTRLAPARAGTSAEMAAAVAGGTHLLREVGQEQHLPVRRRRQPVPEAAPRELRGRGLH